MASSTTNNTGAFYGTGIDNESLSLSIYRTKPFSNNSFTQGLIGFGIIEADSVRKNSGNTLTGSRNGNQLFGSNK